MSTIEPQKLMKAQKLAIFLPSLEGGGAERTMLNLAKGISMRGYAVDLVLAQADGPYMTDVPDSIRLIDLGEGRRVSRFKTIRRLPALVRYLRREKPNVMLSALVEANVVASCARLIARNPARVVVNEQNNLSQKTQNDHSSFQRWYPLIAKFTYRLADRVVGVSQGVVDDLVNNIGIPASKTEAIFNPGITEQVRQQASEPLDHPWFAPDQIPVILSVGRLNVQKDYGTLLKAFKMVRERTDARLLILGDGPERHALEAMINDLELAEHVSLPGFVNNPHAYMSHAAVYALSSRWEGLPTVLVEALYCGAPLVATDCPSGPFEILEAGKFGLLVPMQDPPALAAAILSALDGTSPRASRDCWRRYELENVLDQYIALLFDKHQD